MSDILLPAWASHPASRAGTRRLLVGFSGGVDSSALLHLARQWSAQAGLPLLAIHVNHQLSPHANTWQAHCERVCSQWQIPLVVRVVEVKPAGQGLEAAARNARYEAFRAVAVEGDLLLLGHHRDDQAETVLQRLLRGSGVYGLRGMDALGSHDSLRICRPLLPFSRAELESLVSTLGCGRVDDESNDDIRFDRNFLRHDVLPLLRQRWPHADNAITRAAAHCAEAQALLDERAHEDWLPRRREDGGLALVVESCLSDARWRNLLRYWLRAQSLPLPGEAQLTQVIERLIPAAADAEPVVAWPGCEIRRHRGILYALNPLPPISDAVLTLPVLVDTVLPWGGALLVDHPSSPGAASLQALSAGVLQVRLRRGGEYCHLAGRPGRLLKKILQESALPPWWRDRLPLLYVGDQLAVLPGIGVCEGFQARPGEDAVRIGWQPPVPAWRSL